MMNVRIDRAKSVRAGCVQGVWAELDSVKPSGWVLSRGATEVEMVLNYPYSEDSDGVVWRLFGFVGYRGFSLVEGKLTGSCRLITLLDEGKGVVVTAEAEGHPKPGKPFLVSLVIE
jgi:hypothetical protein